jgi:hypothetical protein
MFRHETQVHEIVDNEEDAINQGNDKADLDDPGEAKPKLGFCHLLLDLGVLFQGKLFHFFGNWKFFCHMVDSIAFT